MSKTVYYRTFMLQRILKLKQILMLSNVENHLLVHWQHHSVVSLHGKATEEWSDLYVIKESYFLFLFSCQIWRRICFILEQIHSRASEAVSGCAIWQWQHVKASRARPSLRDERVVDLFTEHNKEACKSMWSWCVTGAFAAPKTHLFFFLD